MATIDFACDQLMKFQERVVRGTLIDLTNRIILDTPVDTGRLRGNWQAKLNRVSEAVSENINSSVAIMNATRTAASLKIGDDYYLSNNLDYAYNIEMGGSQQNPEGMVRKNVANFAVSLKKAAMQS